VVLLVLRLLSLLLLRRYGVRFVSGFGLSGFTPSRIAASTAAASIAAATAAAS
jgi:hypothetical protein